MQWILYVDYDIALNNHKLYELYFWLHCNNFHSSKSILVQWVHKQDKTNMLYVTCNLMVQKIQSCKVLWTWNIDIFHQYLFFKNNSSKFNDGLQNLIVNHYFYIEQLNGKSYIENWICIIDEKISWFEFRIEMTFLWWIQKIA